MKIVNFAVFVLLSLVFSSCVHSEDAEVAQSLHVFVLNPQTEFPASGVTVSVYNEKPNAAPSSWLGSDPSGLLASGVTDKDGKVTFNKQFIGDVYLVAQKIIRGKKRMLFSTKSLVEGSSTISIQLREIELPNGWGI